MTKIGLVGYSGVLLHGYRVYLQNPQIDAQAQDRAHRIGQTTLVLVFSLVGPHTIEMKSMQRATEKRKLIAKGV